MERPQELNSALASGTSTSHMMINERSCQKEFNVNSDSGGSYKKYIENEAHSSNQQYDFEINSNESDVNSWK